MILEILFDVLVKCFKIVSIHLATIYQLTCFGFTARFFAWPAVNRLDFLFRVSSWACADSDIDVTSPQDHITWPSNENRMIHVTYCNLFWNKLFHKNNTVTSVKVVQTHLIFTSFKPRPNDRNIWTQHIATLLGAFGHPVATCWVLLPQVWKWSNLNQQHSTCRNTSSQGAKRARHVSPNNVAICCVELLSEDWFPTDFNEVSQFPCQSLTKLFLEGE